MGIGPLHHLALGARDVSITVNVVGPPGGEPIDHFRAPTLPRLIGENVAADFPVVKNELSVRSEGGSNLRSANARSDAGEEALEGFRLSADGISAATLRRTNA